VNWLRAGWHVAVAYVVGFAALLLLNGWHPHPPHNRANDGANDRAAEVVHTLTAPATAG